jgi:hypothetical protein
MRSQHGSGQIWVEGGHQARKRSKAQTAVVQYWEHVSPPDVRSRSSQRVVQIGGLQGNIVPCTARCRPATLVCSRPQLIPMNPSGDPRANPALRVSVMRIASSISASAETSVNGGAKAGQCGGVKPGLAVAQRCQRQKYPRDIVSDPAWSSG